ncbi:MAG: hypothetical protein ABEI11_00485 [Haloarculaceae archaeon]
MRAAPDPVRLRRVLGAVLVAGLLVAAGCSALGGPSGAAPTSTITPAPVPTGGAAGSAVSEFGTPSGTDRPIIPVPGLSVVDGAVRVNPGWLGRVHDRALARAGSYRRTVTLTIRTEDGSVVTRDRETVLADRAANRYLIVETPRLSPGPTDEPASYERFVANGTRHAYRRFANGTTWITESPAATPPRGRWRVGGWELASMLARADLRPSSTGDAGAPARYVLVGRFPDLPTSGLMSDPAGGRLTSTVRANGLIRRVRVTYRARSGQQPVAVTLSVGYDRLGRTRVDRPAWLDDPTAADSGRGTDGPTTRSRTRSTAANASAVLGGQPPPSSSRVRRWR